MALLNERFALMGMVADAKKAEGIPLTDATREASILAKTEGFEHAQSIHKVYQCIFIEAKLIQKGRII